MVDILAENLSWKAVMGADGTELGDLYNITMEMKTGGLRSLLVVPNEGISAHSSGFEATTPVDSKSRSIRFRPSKTTSSSLANAWKFSTRRLLFTSIIPTTTRLRCHRSTRN